MLRALALLTLLLWAGVAKAADDQDEAYQALADIITAVPPDPMSDDCTVKGKVDFNEYVNRIWAIGDGFLNRDYSVDFYRQRQRQVFSYVVLKREAEIMTEGIYSLSHSEQECKFSIEVSYNDKFGQDRSFEALTWRFNKEQALKMNWEKFDPRNFNEVALDFTLSTRIADWIGDEPKLGGDAPPVGAQASTAACDMVMFNANAIFIRAATFCRKDCMDGEEGLAALDGARRCMNGEMKGMSEVDIKKKVGIMMLTLDQIAKQRGRSAVCPFVDQVAREVRAHMQ